MSIDAALPSILFVCTGNICRSPTAHALLQHKATKRGLHVQVDSAALGRTELGNPPDRRAVAELQRRGVAMPPHRARQVEPADFRRFDLLLGMTAAHVRALQLLDHAHASKVDLLMRFADGHGAVDVPDPWYGDTQDFSAACDMIENAVDGLLRRWTAARTG